MSDMKFNIVNGEAISELKKFASNTIDLIVADTPYNLGKDYGNDTDKKNLRTIYHLRKNGHMKQNEF
jgi:DNA modification methylase